VNDKGPLSFTIRVGEPATGFWVNPPGCPFQIGYDMGFTSAICEGSNFLFNGAPGLIAEIPRVVA
jgi:hypothetical protein